MSSLVDELFKKLNAVSDELSQELGRQITIREALLRTFESLGLRPSDFAWSWRLNDSVNAGNRRPDPAQ
jgi:hypothetical protein